MYEPEHNHKSGFTIVQVRNGENRKRKQMIHAINKPISYLTLSGFKPKTLTNFISFVQATSPQT